MSEGEPVAAQEAPRNHLAQESSPYLLQHADNPVHWYPWSAVALTAAREQNKPILLSIGYSACHWCHVMEHESFENPDIAALMNEKFINIKVDREERPDLDTIYMQAVTGMTGRGGWPMTVFLTPDLRPFFAGTYFPPEDRPGMPGFPRILKSVALQYQNNHAEVDALAAKLFDFLEQWAQLSSERQTVDAAWVDGAVATLGQAFDLENGGFGGAPKFPQSTALELVLRYWKNSGQPGALEVVDKTLSHMAAGGMHDLLGGGFHRYSVDAQWLIPHFEKMLYDNALLARVYLQGFQATGKEPYADVARGTLDYVLREMSDPAGGFYSSQDADSEGEEGKYYVWDPAEITAVLGGEEGPRFCEFYGVTEAGNFEDGKSVLHVAGQGDASGFAAARQKLLAARAHRAAPAKDDKAVAAWNGMLIGALAQGYQVLGEARYLQAAQKAAHFVLTDMRQNGRLLRTWRKGEAKIPAYLEDYAYLSEALIDLYESDFDPNWLAEAQDLTEAMIALFWDEAGRCFYITGSDQEKLVVRPKDPFDGATPSGSSVAAHVLLRLAGHSGNAGFEETAGALMEGVGRLLETNGTSLTYMLCAVDRHTQKPLELAVVGEGAEPILQAIRSTYLPNKLVAAAAAVDPEETHPLLAGKRPVDGAPSLYICRNYTCDAPLTDLTEIRTRLTQ
ncbi:MAG: thioredoxin domain-containing protein [Candidatus Omnitrophica bacterium]|nr:thioredoxin domain-containing protein [Candidatus Omnitrophota bacterium]